MTNEEAIKNLAMAIKALGHQPCDDCISRQQAIDALDKIFPANPMRNNYTLGITCGVALATECIKQLPSAQPEPCDDCISRQQAIDALYHVDEYNGRSVEAIRNLPSAEPKIGKWILSDGYWRCSECKEKALLKLDKAKGNCKEYAPVRSIFCPNCGTKMEEMKE